MRIIKGLSAAIVPHQSWAARQWFHASGSRYYHRERPRKGFASAPVSYDEIDPHLRELCRLLHVKGLGTTPSCQGHFHGRHYFSARWAVLKREERAIRGGGLRVRDTETGKLYLFRQPGYRLPWPSEKTFYAGSVKHQRTGYLGIVIPAGSRGLCDHLTPILGGLDGVQSRVEEPGGRGGSGYLWEIVVQPRTRSHGWELWSRVTDRIHGSLDGEAVIRLSD